MDDYLSKPFTQQALGQTLSRWIKLPRAALAQDATAPPAERAAPEPINLQALEHIRALSASKGDALLERVLHAFIDDTPAHFKALQQAIAAADTSHIRKAAHSLKSSSANVGAETLAQLCKDMEQLGRNDITEGSAGLLAAMEREFQAVRHALSAIMEKET